jgi:hypothetical protein
MAPAGNGLYFPGGDPRARWRAFRDLVEHRTAVTDDELRDLLAHLRADPSRWFERACVVTLVRGERAVLTDAQLAMIAASYDGKIATFIAAVLRRRHART